ncbi:hypothetical protein N7495_001228 [Penicillium taxi]|uniref:uncharacterized protein n=1 Tax=Penicillium taxi TaxID=168475 RepID=UPI0025453F28|nr:uncharacterized protein N7495_001228 [Penicillium taxi]KAJ5908546.1 hypothetical protein N7495_001228 [Penicillium taxi]
MNIVKNGFGDGSKGVGSIHITGVGQIILLGDGDDDDAVKLLDSVFNDSHVGYEIALIRATHLAGPIGVLGQSDRVPRPAIAMEPWVIRQSFKSTIESRGWNVGDSHLTSPTHLHMNRSTDSRTCTRSNLVINPFSTEHGLKTLQWYARS